MSNNTGNSEKLIKAYPTKDLFISILIRDVTLRDAIGDLLDNAVDGALRLREDTSYEGLWVHIELNADKGFFRISDNCGGISVEAARDYVFCFGRPEDSKETGHSIGVFGIGMKRALFRLGGKFKVESVAQDSFFTMEVDVNEWKYGTAEKGDIGDETETHADWTFEFSDFQEDLKREYPEEERGTKVTVTDLHPGVAESFRIENDTINLIQELQREHLFSINKGLEVTVNGVRLQAPQLTLLESNDLKAAYWESLDQSVKARVYAGVSEQIEYGVTGGWYVFCNKRLVLGPDQSITTGWGIKTPIRIPEYHSQFYRFRGYVFLDAEDPRDLPWNTAKTNIDQDSAVWRTVFQQMVGLMRSVIDFLNSVHTEEGHYNKGRIDKTPLRDSIDHAKFASLTQIVLPEQTIHRAMTKFVSPDPAQPPGKPSSDIVWIRYQVTSAEFEPVKEHFDDIDKPGDVGREIFDYFVEREIEN